MTYTDEQVEQWFKNNLDASEVEIVRAMQVSGVDPAQVSRVTGADPGYVASRFEALTNNGWTTISCCFSGGSKPDFVNTRGHCLSWSTY
jgi:hypothetical protein